MARFGYPEVPRALLLATLVKNGPNRGTARNPGVRFPARDNMSHNIGAMSSSGLAILVLVVVAAVTIADICYHWRAGRDDSIAEQAYGRECLNGGSTREAPGERARRFR